MNFTVLARVADGSNAFQYLIWRSLDHRRRSMGARHRPAAEHAAGVHIRSSHDGRQRGVAAGVDRLRLRGQDDVAGERRLPGCDGALFGVVVARVFLGERIAVAHIHCDGGRARGTGDHGGRRHQCRGRRQGHRRRSRGACLGCRPRSTPRSCARASATGRRSCRLRRADDACHVVTINGDTFVPPATDIALAVVHGAVFIVGGVDLQQRLAQDPGGADDRLRPTELVLVPVWAILLLSERPSASTMMGRTLIVVAVVGMALLDVRDPRGRVLTAV